MGFSVRITVQNSKNKRITFADAHVIPKEKGIAMKIALDIPVAKELLQKRFTLGEPIFGTLIDPDTRTEISIDRDETHESVMFRSQGELLAALVKNDGMEHAILSIYNPSQEVDLYLFWDVLRSFYADIPELLEYIRGGFKTSKENALEGLVDESDRVIYAAIMSLEWYLADFIKNERSTFS